MRSHPYTAVQNLNGVCREVDIHFLMHQSVRQAVEVPPDFDVIVDVDAGLLPLAELIACGRQWR